MSLFSPSAACTDNLHAHLADSGKDHVLDSHPNMREPLNGKR